MEVKFRHAAGVVLLALFATASGEYGREMLRKPYVIGQYMYSNGIRAKVGERLNTDGYLARSLWTRPPGRRNRRKQRFARGEADVPRPMRWPATRGDGYRSMKRLLGERNREGIGSILAVLHDYDKDSPYRKYMPPLVGHPDEIEALGDYLVNLTQKRGKSSTPQQQVSPILFRERATVRTSPVPETAGSAESVAPTTAIRPR